MDGKSKIILHIFTSSFYYKKTLQIKFAHVTAIAIFVSPFFTIFIKKCVGGQNNNHLKFLLLPWSSPKIYS
jgi:hypothetical protein